MKTKGLIIFIFLSVANPHLFAQQADVLDRFTTIQTEETILFNWVIASGSTCNGIRILRSEDSLSFNQIGEILGICGSRSSPIPYSFTDASPIANKTNYYKLQLGDQRNYSNVLAVKFIKLNGGGYTIKPDPVSDEVTIHFQNTSQQTLTFRLIDAQGKQVFTIIGIEDDFISFNRAGIKSGTYMFFLQYNGEVRTRGKIIFN